MPESVQLIAKASKCGRGRRTEEDPETETKRQKQRKGEREIHGEKGETKRQRNTEIPAGSCVTTWFSVGDAV